ncbi:MAG: hypothetical protein ACQEXI_16545 [Pseudomonadota bacterium]
MKDIPSHYPGESEFQQWAASRPLTMGDCKTLDTCIISRHIQDLNAALREHWEAPVEALSVIVGMRAMIRGDWIKASKEDASDPDLVGAWGLASREKDSSVDINESRFLKWARADSWDTFFEHSQIAMRVLSEYRQPFDVKSIYRWVRFRSENPEDFPLAAASQFYHWQYMRGHAQLAPNAATDHTPEVAPGLVQRALDAGYNQSELARRCGVSREYIRLLAAGKREMSFAMQVLLEHLASTKPGS